MGTEDEYAQGGVGFAESGARSVAQSHVPEGRHSAILSWAEAFENALSSMDDEVGDVPIVSYNPDEVAELLIRIMAVNTCKESEGIIC